MSCCATYWTSRRLLHARMGNHPPSPPVRRRECAEWGIVGHLLSLRQRSPCSWSISAYIHCCFLFRFKKNHAGLFWPSSDPKSSLVETKETRLSIARTRHAHVHDVSYCCCCAARLYTKRCAVLMLSGPCYLWCEQNLRPITLPLCYVRETKLYLDVNVKVGQYKS